MKTAHTMEEFKDKVKKLKFTHALKKKWLALLRGGKVKQAREELILLSTERSMVMYCCLAVLGRAAGLKDDEMAEYCSGTLNFDDNGKFFLLPKRVQERLAQLNDGGGRGGPKDSDGEYEPWDFKQIADYVEKKVRVP